jgi:hypothetical protein
LPGLVLVKQEVAMHRPAILVPVFLLVVGVLADPGAAQGTGPAGPSATRIWTQVHGTVERIEGTQLVFKMTDGRRLLVDLSSMNPEERAELAPGERTTLYGYPGERPNQFVAWFLPAESAETAAQASPATAPSAADERAWRIVHGTVERLEGPTLVLKADDGATLAVDMAPVGPGVQSGLAPGERVTVVGVYRSDPDRIEARIVQPSGAEPGRAAWPPAPRMR